MGGLIASSHGGVVLGKRQPCVVSSDQGFTRRIWQSERRTDTAFCMLNTIRHGLPTDRPPLLIAHGLFGSARNWGVIAKRLSTDRQVVAVDMRNHGDSAWHDTHSYVDLAADLAQVIGDTPHDVLGHSMGGKAAMVLALTDPTRLRRLIVADIAPVAYDHTQAHLIAAMRAVDLSGVTRRSDAAAQLMQVPDDGTRSFLLQSLDTADKRWTLNLDTLEAEMPRSSASPISRARSTGPRSSCQARKATTSAPNTGPRSRHCFRRHASPEFPTPTIGCTPRNRANSRRRCAPFSTSRRSGPPARPDHVRGSRRSAYWPAGRQWSWGRHRRGPG